MKIDGASQTFVFALAPTIGSAEATAPERAQPLRVYLEQALERPVRVMRLASYGRTLAALQAGEVDAAMLGEYASQHGATSGEIEPLVTPVADNEQASTYRSVIVTRIDSGIHSLAGLRGETVGLVDVHSTSGYLVPRAMLREAGLDPDQDISGRLHGSHRAVAEAVIAGEAAGGALHASYTTPPSLDRGPDYARLRVLAQSQPIPRGPLVTRSNLDPATRARLAEAMLRIHKDCPEGTELLIRQARRFTVAARPSNPTLKSIAALAGVSYTTVSRVVNGVGRVAPATASRVTTIINELGYRPNGNARVLHGRQAPLVGLVVSLWPDPETSGLIANVHTALAEHGVPVVLCPVAGALSESLFVDVLQDRRLGALIVTAEHAADPELVKLAKTGQAIIAIDVEEPSPGIVAASAAGAAEAVLATIGWRGAAARSG